MLRVHSLDVAHTLYGPLLQRMAPEGIGRVGGVDDDSALVQYLDDAVNVTACVVLLVEFQYHGIVCLSYIQNSLQKYIIS